MNSSSGNLETLYQNIDKYFTQEYQSYEFEINYVISSLESISHFNAPFDIYSVIVLVEKVRISTSLVSCPKLMNCLANIKNYIFKIYSADCILALQLFKQLKIELQHYREFLKVYFEELTISIRKQDCHTFAKQILSRKRNFESYDVAQARTVKLAAKASSEENLKQLLEAFIHLMTRVKIFAKNSCSIKQYFPLKDNPVAELVQLVISKKINSYQTGYKTISDSEALYLKAYEQVHIGDEDLSSLKTPKKRLVINDLGLEYLSNSVVKQKLDNAIFAASQYFLDFDVKSSFLDLKSQQQGVSKNSFEAFIDSFSTASRSLPNIESIHQQMNNQSTPFTDFFGKNNDGISSAEELSALINFYFHKNVTLASYINYLLCSKKTDQLTDVFKFEQVLIDTIKSLKTVNQLSYTANIERLIFCMKKLDKIYFELQAEEDAFLKRSDFMDCLQVVASNYQQKNYKDLTVEYAKANKTLDSERILRKINKYIDSGAYDKATISAKELTHALLTVKYYAPARLYSLYELPPLSAKNYKELSGVDFKAQQVLVSRISDAYEEYWRV
jgi:hypothetical protein